MLRENPAASTQGWSRLTYLSFFILDCADIDLSPVLMYRQSSRCIMECWNLHYLISVTSGIGVNVMAVLCNVDCGFNIVLVFGCCCFVCLFVVVVLGGLKL